MQSTPQTLSSTFADRKRGEGWISASSSSSQRSMASRRSKSDKGRNKQSGQTFNATLSIVIAPKYLQRRFKRLDSFTRGGLYLRPSKPICEPGFVASPRLRNCTYPSHQRLPSAAVKQAVGLSRISRVACSQFCAAIHRSIAASRSPASSSAEADRHRSEASSSCASTSLARDLRKSRNSA